MSYASELGDINAVRMLLRTGPMESEHNDQLKRMLPSLYAAKESKAMIITNSGL